LTIDLGEPGREVDGRAHDPLDDLAERLAGLLHLLQDLVGVEVDGDRLGGHEIFSVHVQ
jgi:hypothetical protein